MIFNGYEGAHRLHELQEELLDRDATPEDRALVEMIKTVALCNIEGHLYQLVRRRGGDR